jgi:hypothetical protein
MTFFSPGQVKVTEHYFHQENLNNKHNHATFNDPYGSLNTKKVNVELKNGL